MLKKDFINENLKETEDDYIKVTMPVKKLVKKL